MEKLKEYLKSLGKSIWNLMIRYPLATLATIILVVLSVILLLSGKTFQIGGLLGRLWGTKKPTNVRGVPPENRKDDKGNVIQPGKSDEKGWVQAPVIKEIVEPNILSDPTELVIIHPDKGKVVIPLPTGVKNTDVKEVVEIQPDIYEIRNNDKGVNPDEALDILGGKK